MVTITTKSAVLIGEVVYPGGKPFDADDSVAECLKTAGVKFVAVAKLSAPAADDSKPDAAGKEGKDGSAKTESAPETSTGVDKDAPAATTEGASAPAAPENGSAAATDDKNGKNSSGKKK